jgi:hypothetical protein
MNSTKLDMRICRLATGKRCMNLAGMNSALGYLSKDDVAILHAVQLDGALLKDTRIRIVGRGLRGQAFDGVESSLFVAR